MTPRSIKERAADRALDTIPVTRALGGRGLRGAAQAARTASAQAGGPLELGRLLATSIPAVVKLLLGLARDRRVALRHRIVLLGLIPYLASPIDLMPDFIPVLGAMDDALLVAVALRWIVRGAGHEVLADNWTGHPEAFALIERLAGVEAAPTAEAAPTVEAEPTVQAAPAAE